MPVDATQVTGSPLAGARVPSPGAVLAERYELLEMIDSDGPVASFRALDQESERQVLVRILVGPGLHTARCDEIVDRLKGLLGVGGRFLSSLLDADREGRSPFTVEPWPRGTPLSAILDSRRSRGEVLGPREALPVIAQLSAALAALPAGLHHGDVRAERVWLDTDGLRLTGPFLLAALPRDELAERIGGLGPGTVAYAPEAKEGLSGSASDLWGVASIAWEALTGRSPDPTAPSPEVEGDLKRALTALLAEAPEQRPPDLSALLSAVSHTSGLSVPNLDPEPHQPPTALVSDMDGVGTEPSGGAVQARPSSEDSLDPRLVRAALGVAMDSDSTTLQPQDTARHPSVSAEMAGDLVGSADRAVRDVGLGDEPSSDALDPRLVRAALGVELDSAEEESSLEMDLGDAEELSLSELSLSEVPLSEVPLSELSSSELLPEPERPAPGEGPVEKVAKKTVGAIPKPSAWGAKLPAGRLPPPRSPKQPAPKRSRPASAQSKPAQPKPAQPKPAQPQADSKPAASKPAQPQADSKPAQPKPAAAASLPSPPAAQPVAQPLTLPEAAPSVPSPGPRSNPPPAPQSSVPASPSGQGASMVDFDIPMEDGTAVLAPRHRRVAAPVAKRRNRRVVGIVIVITALMIAVAIVGVGFLIAGQRRANQARERQLDERLEQLRQGHAHVPEG